MKLGGPLAKNIAAFDLFYLLAAQENLGKDEDSGQAYACGHNFSQSVMALCSADTSSRNILLRVWRNVWTRTSQKKREPA
jgi:hypothetical protein